MMVFYRITLKILNEIVGFSWYCSQSAIHHSLKRVCCCKRTRVTIIHCYI